MSQEQKVEKSLDEILQSSNVGMDDEKTNSDNITTNNKMDPSWVLESPMFKSMEKSTRDKYSKTWLNFINAHGITCDNEPVEEHFLDWFANRKSYGMCLSTLKAEYSHLNKCIQIQYGYSLSYKWPCIWKFVMATWDNQEVKKPPLVFQNGQLERYFEEIDVNNCYLLVRATVAVLTYYYNHIYEIKSNMKWKGNGD